MLNIKNRTGCCHHSTELLMVIMMIGLLIAVLLPVVQSLRVGVRNGLNVQELVGTVVINFGAGLFFVFIVTIAMLVLGWSFIGMMVVANYMQDGKFRNRTGRCAHFSCFSGAECFCLPCSFFYSKFYRQN